MLHFFYLHTIVLHFSYLSWDHPLLGFLSCNKCTKPVSLLYTSPILVLNQAKHQTYRFCISYKHISLTITLSMENQNHLGMMLQILVYFIQMNSPEKFRNILNVKQPFTGLLFLHFCYEILMCIRNSFFMYYCHAQIFLM